MKKSFILILGIFLFGGASSAYAATLYFGPSSATASAGSKVYIQVMTDTQGVNINTVDSTILFPAELLSVESVSKGGSIFSIWAEDPSYSNTFGKINWSGGLPTPGFSGSQGQVLGITFKAKKPGKAVLAFGDSVVLKNDGLGTNVLTGTQGAVIDITPAIVPSIPPVTVPIVVKSPVPVPTKIEVPAAASIPYNLALFLIIMVAGWYKYFTLKIRMREEIDEVIYDTHDKLMSVKAELVKDLNRLEEIKMSRKLSLEEEKVFKELQRKVDKVDKLIIRKLKKIK